MTQKSKTPICDKAEKLFVNRYQTVYLHVAEKLEKSLIKARKQLKTLRDEKRRKEWRDISDENDRRDNLAREAFYNGWS